MKPLKHYRRGFTIVELLVVIVVIGILASIVTVAYTSIQARSYDALIKQDFQNIAKLLRNYQTVNGKLPANSTELTEVGIKVNKSAYDIISVNTRNLGICLVTSPGNERFAIFSLSKSGNMLTYDTNGFIRQYGKSNWPANSSVCTNASYMINFSATETGYWATFGAEAYAPGGWYGWAGG
jgi:prepilin-type N-terminal cleavage/methylation domain-containing protein